MTAPTPPADRPERKYWLDDRRNVDKIFYGLALICAGLFLADFFYHKHVTFAFEDWFGFFAWYGFICCVTLVLLAKQMRKLVKRDEDYYGD
jgi:transposase